MSDVLTAADWDGYYQDDAASVSIPDRVLTAELASLPRGIALDLGCGTGDNALMLARQGWTVVGIDWAPTAIDVATQRAQACGVDATFIAADITSWRSDRMFDLVVSTFALPGGGATRQALTTAVQSLRPGGTIIVVEWSPRMNAVWGAEVGELLSPEHIASLLPDVIIETADTRTIHDLPIDQHMTKDGTAHICVVRGRRAADR